MKLSHFFYFAILITSCGNLEQSIDIVLPEHDEKIVVESYIRPGHSYDLTLSKSTPFFDVVNLDNPEEFQQIFVNDAKVKIISNKREIVLRPLLTINDAGQIINYTSQEIVEDDETQFELIITMSDSRTITSQCNLPLYTDIDSVILEKSDTKNKFRITSYSTDPDTLSLNFYRRTLLVQHESKDTFLVYQDFVFDDQLNETSLLVTGTGYEFGRLDTIVNVFSTLSIEYGEFLNSINGSIAASNSPIGQPGTIFSNTNESYSAGIFTAFTENRDTFIINKAETLKFK